MPKFYETMKRKYIQKVFPKVDTLPYQKLKAGDLRKVAFQDYETFCIGIEVINEHIGLPIHFKRSEEKTAYGEAIYSKKVALIKKLPVLLRYATYNNFGSRKPEDPKEIIGYYNFKAYAIIDGKKESVRLAVKAFKDGSFYYNLEISKKH